MQHPGNRVPLPYSWLVIVLLVALLACERAGRVTIFLDTTSSALPLEVFVLPVDPADLLQSTRDDLTDAQRDTLAAIQQLQLTTDSLDANFQQLRDELNREAADILTIPRQSEEYERRFQEFQPQSARADSLREVRDALRQQLDSIRSAHPLIMPDSATNLARKAATRAALSAATDGLRAARVMTADSDSVSAALESGMWWIGAAAPGDIPAFFRQVVVAEAVSDTVRIRLQDRLP